MLPAAAAIRRTGRSTRPLVYQPAMAGEYRDGMRVGVWTRWFPSGGKRVQAEFADGLQDGAMIAWDEHGAKVYESRFDAGVATAR